MKVKNLKGEEIERNVPKSGEYWRHFKGNVYRILAVGHFYYPSNPSPPDGIICQLMLRVGVKNKEAQEYKVDKQNAVWYERDKIIYSRDLDDFMDVTPTHKYPDAKQEWRFEKVEEND